MNKRLAAGEWAAGEWAAGEWAADEWAAGKLAAGGAQGICPLNNLNSCHCIIIKLCENVCCQNISAKFDNQPHPMK